MSKENNETPARSSSVKLLSVIQVTAMILLTAVMAAAVADGTVKNTVSKCTTLAEEKSSSVESFIQNAETVLTEYSCADEILNILKSPDNFEYIKAAQKYTDKVAETVNNLDSIYVSTWNARVLVHSDHDIKKSARMLEEDELSVLYRYVMESDNHLYDAGFTGSPSSDEQIFYIYMAVFDDNGLPAGIAGLGFKADEILSGLERSGKKISSSSSCSIIDAETGKYIFCSDKNKINTRACSAVAEKADTLKGSVSNQTGTFTYKDGSLARFAAYSYNRRRGWVCITDGPHNELFAMTFKLIIFLIVFSAVYIAAAVLFNRLRKKHEDTVNRLQSSMNKNAKTKESLNKAVFQDILTDCRNRIAFSKDFESGNKSDSPDLPYYFLMFNISEFSTVNIMYGEDIGDEVLTAVAETLRSTLTEAEIYRTGSDEFVAAMQSKAGAPGIAHVTNSADKTLTSLLQPVTTSAGPVMTNYRASIVRKSTDIDPSVLPALKDISNQAGPVNPGRIPFLDMDTLS